MKASVVIPHADRHAYIRNALLALAAQVSLDDFEVIVVDYGTDSRLGDELTALGSRFPLRYQHLREAAPNCVSHARNVGAALARNELLVFLDCDIVVGSDFVQQHLRGFRHVGERARVLQLGTRRYLRPGAFEYGVTPLEDFLGLADERFRLFAAFSENFGALQGGFHLAFSNNISLSRSFFLELGGFDEGFRGWGLEDCELGYRVTRAAGRLVLNPLVGVHHQHHETNFDAERYRSYARNLAHFLSKHREVEAALQLVFDDFFDPERRARREARGIVDVWADCFERFERALRELASLSQPRRRLTLHDASLARVEDALRSDPDLEVVVHCNKRQLELIVDLQLSAFSQRIALHTY